MNQDEVLDYLREHGESKISDIMADTGCSRQNIQQRLQQLHRYKLVEKVCSIDGITWRVAQ